MKLLVAILILLYPATQHPASLIRKARDIGVK